MSLIHDEFRICLSSSPSISHSFAFWIHNIIIIQHKKVFLHKRDNIMYQILCGMVVEIFLWRMMDKKQMTRRGATQTIPIAALLRSLHYIPLILYYILPLPLFASVLVNLKVVVEYIKGRHALMMTRGEFQSSFTQPVIIPFVRPSLDLMSAKKTDSLLLLLLLFVCQCSSAVPVMCAYNRRNHSQTTAVE